MGAFTVERLFNRATQHPTSVECQQRRTPCHDDQMELDAVRALPMTDQMTYLRGRILESALSMEAVARYLHVKLGGSDDLEAALDTPQQFQMLVRELTGRATACERLSDRTRPLALNAIDKAGVLYERRNRFVHDALRHKLTTEEQWELSKLWRPKRENGGPLPEPEPVSAQEMMDLVFDLIETTWRLRGALWCLITPSKEISPYLTHRFTPQWDGSFLPLRGASTESIRTSQH